MMINTTRQINIEIRFSTLLISFLLSSKIICMAIIYRRTHTAHSRLCLMYTHIYFYIYIRFVHPLCKYGCGNCVEFYFNRSSSGLYTANSIVYITPTNKSNKQRKKASEQERMKKTKFHSAPSTLLTQHTYVVHTIHSHILTILAPKFCVRIKIE